jgi:3-methyladenine DNA glycosylase Mpg
LEPVEFNGLLQRPEALSADPSAAICRGRTPRNQIMFGPAGDASQPPWVATPRIGISQAQTALWRFCVVGSPYVSGKKIAAPSASLQI